MAALGRQAVIIHKPLISEDAEITLIAIRKFGYSVIDNGDSVGASEGASVGAGLGTMVGENSKCPLSLLMAASPHLYRAQKPT